MMILPLCIALYAVTVFMAIFHCLLDDTRRWLKALSGLAFIAFFVAASLILTLGWWLNTLAVPAAVWFRAPTPMVEFDI